MSVGFAFFSFLFKNYYIWETGCLLPNFLFQYKNGALGVPLPPTIASRFSPPTGRLRPGPAPSLSLPGRPRLGSPPRRPGPGPLAAGAGVICGILARHRPPTRRSLGSRVQPTTARRQPSAPREGRRLGARSERTPRSPGRRASRPRPCGAATPASAGKEQRGPGETARPRGGGAGGPVGGQPPAHARCPPFLAGWLRGSAGLPEVAAQGLRTWAAAWAPGRRGKAAGPWRFPVGAPNPAARGRGPSGEAGRRRRSSRAAPHSAPPSAPAPRAPRPPGPERRAEGKRWAAATRREEPGLGGRRRDFYSKSCSQSQERGPALRRGQVAGSGAAPPPPTRGGRAFPLSRRLHAAARPRAHTVPSRPGAIAGRRLQAALPQRRSGLWGWWPGARRGA